MLIPSKAFDFILHSAACSDAKITVVFDKLQMPDESDISQGRERLFIFEYIEIDESPCSWIFLVSDWIDLAKLDERNDRKANLCMKISLSNTSERDILRESLLNHRIRNRPYGWCGSDGLHYSDCVRKLL